MKALVELVEAAIYDNLDGLGVDEDRVPRRDGTRYVVAAVRTWLEAMSQDGQVPANRDLRDEYRFLIHEAGKGLDGAAT